MVTTQVVYGEFFFINRINVTIVPKWISLRLSVYFCTTLMWNINIWFIFWFSRSLKFVKIVRCFIFSISICFTIDDVDYSFNFFLKIFIIFWLISSHSAHICNQSITYNKCSRRGALFKSCSFYIYDKNQTKVWKSRTLLRVSYKNCSL